jgi:hypothetical protein
VASTVKVNFGTGLGESLVMGTPSGPASHLFAAFDVVSPVNTANSVVIDDSGATATNTYVVNTAPGTISGTGINYNEGASSLFAGGITIKGAPVDGSVFNVLSVAGLSEPLSIITGAVGGTTVNVGFGNVLSVGSALAIHTAGGTATVNLNDQSDTAHATATLDNLSGNGNAPYEVTGLSTAAIEYGSGVTALNIHGGTSGSAGVTFNINNTQSGTTATISGGAHQNFINLSNAGESGGLDNLPGPVVVHGGAAGSDVVTVNDSSGDFNDNYTITSTTVGRVIFGGLTYDSTIGTLSLLAENTLGTNGNNSINVNSTADSITTNINGQGGNDTITVSQTGSDGILNITTGTAGSTVNLLADTSPVNIFNNGQDTDNIGSTGGAGTLHNILFPVSISNAPSFNIVNIHDENSSAGKTWTINVDNVANTESVDATGVGLISFRPGDLNALTIDGGTASNIFNVDGSANGVSTTIQGNGLDTFNIAGSALGDASANHFIGDGSLAIFNISPVSQAGASVSITGGAPLAFPGDQLNYSALGAIQPGAAGAGTITQSGFQNISFTGIDVVTTAAYGIVSAPGGYVLTATGDQAYGNQADQFLIGTDSTGQFLQVSSNGVMGFYGDQGAVFRVNVNALGGNDDLTVDSSGGLTHIAGGIYYDGGAGVNTLHLTQTGGATQTSDTYSVGPNPGDARSVIAGPSGTQSIFAMNLAGVTDVVPASSFIVNGTPAHNFITATKGASAGSGSVSIDNFAPIQYSNKVNLSINGMGGSDVINNFGVPGTNENPFNAANLYDLTTSTSAGKPAPGIGPVAVATGDLTGSGFDDIVTVNEKTGNISVLINNGDGTFKAPIVFKSGGLKPQGLVIGNFDSHPGLDLAVTNSGSADIAIFSGNDAGGFGTPTFIKTAADPTAIVAGFINGDANEDLVVTNSSLGAITVLLGNGTGGFAPTAPIKTPIKVGGKDPVALAVSDFNKDGKADIVTANYGSGNVSFFAGNGLGVFATPTLFAVGPHPTSLAVGDINKDGKLDLAVSDGTKNIVSILYGNGAVAAATQFQPQLRIVVAGFQGSTSVVLDDFNGDGQLDIGLAHTTGGAFSILLGTGSGTFSQPYQIALGSSPIAATTGVVIDDLAGNGMLDIVAATQSSNDVRVLLATA